MLERSESSEWFCRVYGSEEEWSEFWVCLVNVFTLTLTTLTGYKSPRARSK
jgi:hypothetical protein